MENETEPSAMSSTVPPSVKSFFAEVGSENPFWMDIFDLFLSRIERCIKQPWPRTSSMRPWAGMTEPEPADVFNEAIKLISNGKRKSWDPHRFDSEINGAQVITPAGASGQWTAQMWSFYQYLKRYPLFESIVRNWARLDDNKKAVLDELSDYEKEDSKGDKKTLKVNFHLLPHGSPPPDKIAQKNEAWRTFEEEIEKSPFKDKSILHHIAKQMWNDKEGKWDAETAATELQYQFPDLSVQQLTERIYKASSKKMPRIASEYAFTVFSEWLPRNLRSIARYYYRDAATYASTSERIEHFCEANHVSRETAREMLVSLRDARDAFLDENPLFRLPALVFDLMRQDASKHDS